MSKFSSLFKGAVKEAIAKINDGMREMGIVYLTDPSFYEPNDCELSHYMTGRDYAVGRHKWNITLEDLLDVATADESCGYDFSNFTPKEKFDKFIKSGFKKLQEEQKNEFNKWQRSSLVDKVRSLEDDVRRSQSDLEAAKAELAKYDDKNKQEGICGR